MRTIKKTISFTEIIWEHGACEYHLWNKATRQLAPCGEPGHKYYAGNKSYFLCAEHGAFIKDAFDVTMVNYKGAQLKAGKE